MTRLLIFCILILLEASAFAPLSLSAARRLSQRWRPKKKFARIMPASHASDDDNDADDVAIVEYDDFLPQPNTEWEALDVVIACMSVLNERKDAGLEVCFHFSSDRCRAALGGSLERFAEYATNPIFGHLVNCIDYEIISVGSVIAGTPTRGAMQTILMEVKHPGSDGGDDKEGRRFLWTMQRERRPPRQNCWMIHEVIYVRNAFQLTV